MRGVPNVSAPVWCTRTLSGDFKPQLFSAQLQPVSEVCLHDKYFTQLLINIESKNQGFHQVMEFHLHTNVEKCFYPPGF